MTLATADIHLWPFDLDDTPPADWLTALDPAEQARAQRFVFERDARRFRHGRATLRHLLARFTGLSAHTLPLGQAAQGKPVLQAPQACHFNLSHSGAHALLAISGTFELGIDIEVPQDTGDLDALAQHTLTPAEHTEWRALPPDQRVSAFFNGWTRKEAVLKAIGLGLHTEPHSLHVGLGRSDATLPFTFAGKNVTLLLRSWQAADHIIASLALCVPTEQRLPAMNLIEHPLDRAA